LLSKTFALPTTVENQINNASLTKNADVHASKTVSGYLVHKNEIN
jgi:hypothetical protein